jgi:hypothetical protein
MVRLPAALLDRYERFSLYNSPYPAHDHGCAVDLYTHTGVGIAAEAPSPVAGEVTAVRTVRCPDRPYAGDTDHLVVIDVADPEQLDAPPGTAARVLHVDPAVDPGDVVAAGDSLGTMVRSGFFGRWVANHLHLGFRPPGADPHRASGSLPLSPGVDVDPVAWDGRGTVVESGPTHVRLDAPVHPNPGPGRFVGLGDSLPLDGGLAHYRHGGVFAPETGPAADCASADAGASDGETPTAVRPSLLGTPLGRLDGRDVEWDDVGVFANGHRVTGLSLFASSVDHGAKLVAFDHSLSVGDPVEVTVRPVESATVLG